MVDLMSPTGEPPFMHVNRFPAHVCHGRSPGYMHFSPTATANIGQGQIEVAMLPDAPPRTHEGWIREVWSTREDLWIVLYQTDTLASPKQITREEWDAAQQCIMSGVAFGIGNKCNASRMTPPQQLIPPSLRLSDFERRTVSRTPHQECPPTATFIADHPPGA